MDSSLVPFVRPRGIVVVGASTSPEKLGHAVARNLAACGYSGAIHFVGQKPGELFGRQIFAEVSGVPDPVDLAVLVIPAGATPAALSECAARGIRACIILSAGFREAGPEGASLEARCLSLARAHGMRLLGPNCIGVIDTHLPLDTSFLRPPMPPEGGVAFITQSGAFGAAIVDWARGAGFGFSQIVSLGNQADVNETDMLPMVLEDHQTRVITLYLEGVADGARFVRTAREVARHRPVLALKVGRSASGRRAAASHTAALAGSDIGFDAALLKCGVFRANSGEQLFDWARALEACPLPRGRGVAVLTDAGGPGVIAADALEINGLILSELGQATQALLSSQLPAAASVLNPVDMLASASPTQYARCLEALLRDAAVDAALVILPAPPTFTAESVAEALIPVIHTSQKPVVVALLGSHLVARAFDMFGQARIPTYPFPERAISALAVLARRSESLATPLAPPEETRPHFDSLLGPMAPPFELLTAYGIPLLSVSLVKSPDEAAARAAELGFPIVMKIASPQILHKSDIGGVILDIDNEAAANRGYTQLIAAARTAVPDGVIDGVHLQRQLPPGQDVIVGAVRDPQFGPLIMFGAGGVEVEGLRDVAFALAPLTPAEADDLIHRTWAGRKLDGFRGIPAVDKAAARDALIRLSWLVHEHPELSEIELNPLRVLDRGAYAVDVRLAT